MRDDSIRIIKNKEDLESVRYVRVRELRISFPELGTKEITLKREKENLEIPLHRAFSGDVLIGEFILFKDARSFIIEQLLMQNKFAELASDRLNELWPKKETKSKHSIKRKIFRLLIALVTLGLSVWAFIQMLNK